MKMITAIIKPHRLDDLRQALSQIGLEGMTVQEVRGFGRQRGHTELYRGAEYQIAFVPKTQVDVIVSSDRVDEVVDTIIAATRSGAVGDGKIFVRSVDDVIRIRTGEHGHDAI